MHPFYYRRRSAGPCNSTPDAKRFPSAARRLLSHPARSDRGGRTFHPAGRGERARGYSVGRSLALELWLVPPLGRRAGADADDEGHQGSELSV